jgi:ATP-dependent DNA helicase RecG
MLPPTSQVGRLRGVGPALARQLATAGIERIADLFWLLPVGWDDLGRALDVAQAVALAEQRPRLAVRGIVSSAGPVFLRGRRATRIVLTDRDGAKKLTLWWFFAAPGLLARAKPGAELLSIGRVSPSRRGPGARMAHPDLLPAGGPLPSIRSRYPRAGVSGERVRSLVSEALSVSEVPELVPPEIAAREGFGALAPLVRKLHAPGELPTPGELYRAHEQLAWAEAFARVLVRRTRDAALCDRPSPVLPVAPGPVEQVRTRLGFELTTAQARAIDEISSDLAGTRPMRRLVLGDVGSGKTAVALAAIAQCVAAGRQAAVLAPTGVLAEQYRAAVAVLEQALGCRAAVLTAGARSAERAAIERDLAAGTLDVLVGTHALLERSVGFRELALVVVDEQQRFGVAQRLAMVEKAALVPHLLTLSATPIPRTLALALRGEVATSLLDTPPPGRKPVTTELVSRGAWEPRVLAAIEATAQRGEGIFVVCPRIGGDDDDGSETAGAVERYSELARRLGKERVVLAHAGLPNRVLAQAVERFRHGQAAVLVGTTVVEVGIDVPHATLMVIDAAESFGLAQLHQLRGRVGRSRLPSQCLLVHEEPLAEPARSRLTALLELADGAAVARRDLELRGPGELSGTRQSGDAGLFFLDSFAQAPWLARICDDVARMLEQDPKLECHEGLSLFVQRTLSGAELREDAL